MKKFKELREKLEESSPEALMKSLVLEETGYTLTEIQYLSADGRESPPAGSFFSKGQWYKEAMLNETAFTGSALDETEVLIPEGVSPEQYGLKKFRGGSIVFSTDVNAVKASENKLKDFVMNKFETFKNRVLKNRKLVKLIQKHNLSHEDDFFIGSFSIGKFFNGRYVGADGQVYDEKSSSIEILGVPSEVLLLLGTEIAKEFKQETVLVKDFNKNKFYLADRKKVDDVSKEVERV